jgi:dTDP-4-amino-4,6-dideoxygalactose transaminase
MALLAGGVGPGDEVITVSHSFIATANSVRYTGAVPVFVDIEPGTFNMAPDLIEHAITKKTKAILCVHQLGMPCDLKKILEIAQRYSLFVVEDAACAIGSEILWDGKWHKIGKPIADVACFSFHPRKVITTGDGGMITTADPAFDKKFKLLRQHGMSVPDTKRHNANEVIFETYDILGFNYRMTDIQAAVGREQLKRLSWILGKRRELAKRYMEELADVTGLVLPEEPSWARSNWQSFCVRLPDAFSQRRVMQFLLDNGISTRRGVMCAHMEEGCSAPECYRVPAGGSLLESEKARDRCVILPLYPQMTDDDFKKIVALFRAACRAGREE